MVKSFAAATNLGIYIFVKDSLLGAHEPSAAQLAADLDCTDSRRVRSSSALESEVLRLLGVTA
jgi:hypothetical protein